MLAFRSNACLPWNAESVLAVITTKTKIMNSNLIGLNLVSAKKVRHQTSSASPGPKILQKVGLANNYNYRISVRLNFLKVERKNPDPLSCQVEYGIG